MLSEAERRISILDYIRKNSPESDPRITKSDLMKYLKDSRMMTTHKTIVQLIKEGKIKILRPKDKPYRDYLVVNEENEFNKIYNFLSKIEDLIDKMQNAARNMKITARKMKTGTNELEEFVKFTDNFVSAYYDTVDSILHTLLHRTKLKIRSEIDKNILYNKITETLSNLHHHFLPMTEMLDHIVNVRLKNARSSPVFKATDVDVNLIDDLTQVIENFKKEFLT